MKKFVLFYLIINFTGLFAQNQSNSLSRKYRAMWIWNSENSINNLVNDVGHSREALYEFCRSPHGNFEHEIKVLFLGCSEALLGNTAKLREFLADAHANELTIEYLDGDPSWATNNQNNGIYKINKVLEFNASASSEDEKFDGIQFDVEPYLLTASRGYKPPYWDTDKDSVWTLYVAYMDSCQKIIDKADSSLYFGIAIPRWYENHVGNSELFRLQSVVDYVAIMDYNEKSSVIINDARNEINNASALNKKVWIGVETKKVSPETVSFYEEGVLFMETELAKVLNVYAENPVFSGIAIHAYHYYKSLPLTTSVATREIDSPLVALYQNTENPVRSNTTIKYQLPTEMAVEISIFNSLGQRIATLVNEAKSPGMHEIVWNSAGFSSGLYFVLMKTPGQIIQKKMLIVR